MRLYHLRYIIHLTHYEVTVSLSSFKISSFACYLLDTKQAWQKVKELANCAQNWRQNMCKYSYVCM